ncbi:hypothetical protein KSP40_PGU005946 [Platanthera guangdongensis]|uniref:Uncharacterized protein n=1 Tax=Platanthera guangdongensis TaxID=2320717 RepID=A0ABR2LJG3_9ASPA
MEEFRGVVEHGLAEVGEVHQEYVVHGSVEMNLGEVHLELASQFTATEIWKKISLKYPHFTIKWWKEKATKRLFPQIQLMGSLSRKTLPNRLK